MHKSSFSPKDSVQECCAVSLFLALADRPNHIWGIDITYIQLQHGWLYMTAVLDWYSRYVVSWVLSQTLELEFVLAAVDNALLQAVSEIRNSDQGSHFTNPRYLERL